MSESKYDGRYPEPPYETKQETVGKPYRQLCEEMAGELMRTQRDLAAMTKERDAALERITVLAHNCDDWRERTKCASEQAAGLIGERDAALQRAKDEEAALDDEEAAHQETLDLLNRTAQARLAAEAEAGAMREALDFCHDNADCPTSALNQELARLLDVALSGTAARPLADFLARLRAAPCRNLGNCPRDYGKDHAELWCWPCQSRSLNYGGTP